MADHATLTDDARAHARDAAAAQRAAEDARFVARFGPAPRSSFVRAGGVQLHLLHWGDPSAAPLLMVHGMRGHARWFTPVGPAMAARYHVMSLDMRGHGLSEAGEGAAMGPITYADDLVELIEALDLQDLVLLGHSMGGSVVVRAAERVQSRLRVLVTVDAGLGPPPESTPEQPRPRAMSEPRPRRYYDSYDEARARFVLRPGQNDAEPALLDHLALHAIRALPDGRHTWRYDDGEPTAASAGPRPRPGPVDGSAIRCPVLGIYGEKSPILQRVDPATFGARFPAAASVQVEILKDAYHHTFLDRPREFNQLLLELLGRH